MMPSDDPDFRGFLARVWFAALLTLVALVALAIWAVWPAQAHDSWISQGAHRNPSGEWCCGEGDCGMLDHGAVTPAMGGYRINGFMTLGEGAGALRIEMHDFVPFNETQPSPDGEYWICVRPNRSRRCFFAPPAMN